MPYRLTLPLVRAPALIALVLATAACNEEGGGVSTDCVSGVRHEDLNENTAARIEVNLRDLGFNLSELEQAVDQLAAAPDVERLATAQEALYAARVGYAYLAPYALIVDPAASRTPAFEPFPTDTATVRGYLANGAVPSGPTEGFDRGFPAVEWLLHRRTPTATVTTMRADPAYGRLLSAYVDTLSQTHAQLVRDWEDDGSANLVAATGTGAGSGLSQLINSLSKHYEDLRRDQLGTPFGVTLGFPTPAVVQAPYSGRSLDLLMEGIRGSSMAFGRTSALASLANYVDQLDTEEADLLAAEIVQQYGAALSASLQVDSPLSRAIESDRDAVQQAYNAISRQVVFLKTDLPSVACVAITYVDNPSDSD